MERRLFQMARNPLGRFEDDKNEFVSVAMYTRFTGQEDSLRYEVSCSVVEGGMKERREQESTWLGWSGARCSLHTQHTRQSGRTFLSAFIAHLESFRLFFEEK